MNHSHFRHLCLASKMECFRNHLSKVRTPSVIPSVASDHLPRTESSFVIRYFAGYLSVTEVDFLFLRSYSTESGRILWHSFINYKYPRILIRKGGLFTGFQADHFLAT